MRGAIAVALLACCVGCVAADKPSAKQQASSMDKAALLRHKIECRNIGVKAEKEEFPDGKNTVEALNQGLVYREPEYAYNEPLNTCVMLSGLEQRNLKTGEEIVFQAQIKDLLSNKTLSQYWLIAGKLSQASASRADFMKQARELFADPLPKWLEMAP
jgi:hypothetical protein